MRREMLRQAVHLSGFVFVFILFASRAMGLFLLFSLSAFMLLYQEHIKKPKKTNRLEKLIRHVAFKLVRKDTNKPFLGAFWFYFGIGFSFLVFPIKIAMVSSLILILSDSLSTLIGLRFGSHKLFGSKTIEGSFVFFLSSLIISSYIINPVSGLLCSFFATFAELVPEFFKNAKHKEIINDNILIPLASGFILLLTQHL